MEAFVIAASTDLRTFRRGVSFAFMAAFSSDWIIALGSVGGVAGGVAEVSKRRGVRLKDRSVVG